MKHDIYRRCKSHYKLPDYTFFIHDPINVEELLAYYQQHLNNTNNISVTNDSWTHHGSLTLSPSSRSPVGPSSPSSPFRGGSPVQTAQSRKSTRGKGVAEEKGFDEKNISALSANLDRTKDSLDQLCQIYEIPTLVLGLTNPSDFQLTQKGSLTNWAVWDFPGDCILTKGMSYVRPFTDYSIPRTFLLYLNPGDFPKNEAKLEQTLQKALKYYRTGDQILVLSNLLPSDPIGDNQQLRFDFGKRHLWLKSQDTLDTEPNRIGWNDEVIAKYTDFINNAIKKSFLTGRVIIERNQFSDKNIVQMITTVAFQENIQSIVFPNDRQHQEIIQQCIRDYPYSLILLK